MCTKFYNFELNGLDGWPSAKPWMGSHPVLDCWSWSTYFSDGYIALYVPPLPCRVSQNLIQPSNS